MQVLNILFMIILFNKLNLLNNYYFKIQEFIYVFINELNMLLYFIFLINLN